MTEVCNTTLAAMAEVLAGTADERRSACLFILGWIAMDSPDVFLSAVQSWKAVCGA